MTKNDDMPLGTYRLQLSKDFTLRDAQTIVPYLHAMGLSHLYLSPIFESTPGSTHGYDIADFAKVSEERGGEESLIALDETLMAQKMGLLLDIVPNHMCVSHSNPYFFDVLKHGRASPYWPLFDMRVNEDQKIHLPVLAKPLKQTIEEGLIKKSDFSGEPVLDFQGKLFPLNDQSQKSDVPLEDLIGMQHYVLVPWTETFDVITYRRFFDIFDLIGVRVEDQKSYDLSHAKLIELTKTLKSFYGVRVDHIDGLSDPAGYMRRLHDITQNIWIEKILATDEDIIPEWNALGTTGYKFIHYANNLFVHPQNFKKISDHWKTSVETRWESFESCVLESKTYVLRTLFSSEIKRLAALTDEGPAAELFWMGISATLAVYRTYFAHEMRPADEALIRQANEKAIFAFGDPYKFAAEKYLPQLLNPQTERQKEIVREWQQLSGPAMAKGLEDTAHYRYTPLAALNDVGCVPVLKDNGAQIFADWVSSRQKNWPRSLNATSTHDTKRSEDARCRLYALADDPDRWIEFFEAAQKITEKSSGIPDPATEYFIYQAILCTWPLDDKVTKDYIDRLCRYMEKAGREKRDHTSWFKPDAAYESTIRDFITTALNDSRFCAHVASYAADLSRAGAINSLSLLTLKILSPGVPDIYQGMELWDFSLVDPDNRRPVDYKKRQSLLETADEKIPQSLLKNWKDGAIKLWLTRRLLQIRRDHLSRLQIFRHVPSADHLAVFEINNNLLMVLPRFPLLRLNPENASLSLENAQNSAIEWEHKNHKYTNLLTDQIMDHREWQNPLKDFPVGIFLKG